jgi:hypothetical protein
MTMVVKEIRDAFREAKVSDATADAAGAVIAAQDARVTQVESRLSLLTWMVGTNVVLTIAEIGGIIGILTRLH